MKKRILNPGAPGLLALLFSTLLTIEAQDAGFFLDDWQEKQAEIPAWTDLEKPTTPPTVTITVDAAVEVNKVPHYIYGNNAVTWDNGLPKNPTAMTDLKNLNPNVLRWPGGSLSDNYFWNVPVGQRPSDIPTTISPWYGQNTDSWQMSTDEYYQLREKTNSQGIIVVNYGYARYGTGPTPVATAAHMAAEWVRYDNGRTKFWEIGNENFGSWESGYEINQSLNQDGQPRLISGQLYGQHCRVFIDSMRAAAAEVGADIKIGVVAYDAETSHAQISTDWNEGMMPEVGDVADFISVHSYFTPYDQNSTVSTILNSHGVPEEIYNTIVSDMAEAGKPMIPVAMTEWNIFAVGSMQQVSYINGMLAALVLGEFIQNDYGLGTRWDLVNGWSDGNDHGMFSSGGEPGVDPYNPRAAFFYMYYFQKYFGDRMVESTVTGNNSVIAYGSTFTSGEASIVLINKSTAAETALVEIANFDPGIRYYTYTLTGGDDNFNFSRRVLINGVVTDEQGGGPDNYATLKAFSSETEGGIAVSLPPLSVVYILADKKGPLSYVSSIIKENPNVISVKFSEAVTIAENPSGIEILLNGTVPATIASTEVDPTDARWINVTVEEELTFKDLITISYSGDGIRSLENLSLSPFTDEPVKNLLPGDPVAIVFEVVNSQSGTAIEACEVTFNNALQLTDENGLTTFNARTGEYLVSAQKTFLQSVENRSVTILSDTTITLLLDSTAFNVTFELQDKNTGEKIALAEVRTNEIIQLTDGDGLATLPLFGGNQTVVFVKKNYHRVVNEFEILNDSLIAVEMDRSHAQVKFKLRYGEQPVSNAAVTIGNIALTTNAVGICTFESLSIDTTYNYSVTKEYFYDLEGSLNALRDTTVTLQMEKSVANIEFIVAAESGTIENVFAVIEEDTAWFNSENRARFFNLNKNEEYSYSILSEKFQDYTGSILLEGDTSINVTLLINSVDKHSGKETIRIYPNPATSFLTIENDFTEIDALEITDITGKRVLNLQSTFPQRQLTLQLNLPEGLYFLRILSGQKSHEHKLVIQQ